MGDDVGRTQEPIVVEVSTQEPIVTDVSTQEPIIAEISTQEPIMAECNDEFDESTPSIDDDDDDEEEDFLVDEENEIIEPDVDVHLFGISMDLPFDNIGVTNLVPDDVLEGEDVDVINADGFNNDPSNDDELNYRRRRLAELSREMEGVMNDSGQWKRRNLKLYKNGSVGIRARCDGKVPVLQCHKIFDQVRVNLDIPVKVVQDQLQRDLEVQIFMSKAFRAKAKAGKEIRGYHVMQYFMLRDYVIELQFTNPNTTIKIAVERNIDPSLPTTGIAPAIKTVYPSAEHRYCLRHIHENMKQGWCGQAYKDLLLREYKDLLWRAASATNVRDFKKCMLDLKTMNSKLNNIYEVFNGKIVGGRDMPVIIIFEYIKEYCMKRIMNVQGVLDKCIGPLTPTVTRIMESIKKEAHLMKDQVLREVHMSNNTFATQASCLGGNNVEASSSASRQAQQIECAVCQDGLAGSGGGAVIGLSAGQGGPDGSSQESETSNVDGREMGDGIPTQSSAAGGASEWSFL
ncbi:hypothetical protein Tco_0179531 [Tanacetum coccineum]